MKKGFTLIELIVVIGIIALLSTITVVSLSSVRAKARDAKRKSDLSQIQRLLSAQTNCYIPDHGTGDYDLSEIYNELKTKYPQLLQYVTLPKDPKTGSEAVSGYHYLVSSDTACVIYTNLENKDEPITLSITTPTTSAATGVLKSTADGPNGTNIFYQISR